MNEAYAHFTHTHPPVYMQNKLRNMSNDKGYIYRGIVFLGKLPVPKGRPEQLVLFEKGENGRTTTIIHEYNKKRYRQILWDHVKQTKTCIADVPRA